MSDLEQLTQIITNIMTGDTATIQQNEALLKQLRERDINQYIITFATLLSESPHKEIRIFSSVHLRRNISALVDAQEECYWLKLSGENQRAIKEQLWIVLKKEQIPAVRKVICELIGELAATIMNYKYTEEDFKDVSEEGLKWDDLMPRVWELMNSDENGLIEGALKIMGILLTFCMNDFAKFTNELGPMFKRTLEHSDYKIKSAAIEAYASFIKTGDYNDSVHLIELIPLVLTGAIYILEKDEDLAAEALVHITEIIEGEPKMFRKNFRDLFDMIKIILQKDVVQGFKEGAMEALVKMCEKSPKLVSKNSKTIKEIFETLFLFMVMSTEEATNDWLVPPEGFVETNEDPDSHDYTVKYCIEIVDRLIVALGEATTLPILSNLLVEMVSMNDWRYTYTSLMSLSQVGEYMDDISQLDPIIEFILKFTHNEHPKVRYAALHAIGQIADDKKENFQGRYLDTVLPHIRGLMEDNVPHVVSHCVSAIVNIIEKLPKDDALRYIDSLWEPFVKLVQQGSSVVRESAMTGLATLAGACGDGFIPYWQRTAEVVFEILKNETKKELKKLRGQAIETLTVTGYVVGKDEFSKVAGSIIQTMGEIQQNHIDEVDPQKEYLLLGWERVCQIMKQDFQPYLEHIVPQTLNIIENIINNVTNRKGNQTKESSEVMGFLGEKPKDAKDLFHTTNTAESEEVHIAIELLQVFAYELKDCYLPYVERTSDLLVYLLDKSSNEDVRASSAECLASIIGVVRTSNLPNKDEIIRKIANTYITKLFQALWEDFDLAEDITRMVKSIQDIMVASGKYMNEEELGQFNANILKTLKDSDARKNINFVLIDRTKKKAQESQELGIGDDDDYEDDEEAIDYLNEDTEKEEQLHCAIAELIGAVFYLYKEMALPLCELIYKEVLPKVLNLDLSVYMNKFGLLLVNAMLECLGFELIQNQIKDLAEIVLKYSKVKNAELRKVGVRGISLLASTTKEHFQPITNECLITLGEALKMTKQEGDGKNFKAAKENVIAALGQIIKCQLQFVSNQGEIINTWLMNLPLTYEEYLAKVQHELLVDIILEVNAGIIFGDKGENLPQVIKIFSETLGTKLTSGDFEGKVVKILQFLMKNEETKSALEKVVLGMDKNKQEKFRKLIQ